MNNEDAQAIRHAVYDGIEQMIRTLRSDPVARSYFEAGWKAYELSKDNPLGERPAPPVCPHCGTPWTLWQRRGYDKHPCEGWRTERASEAHSALQGHCGE